MSGWVLAIAVFTIQVSIPTISSFSTAHRHSQSGRKLFGGYRIVPKTCVSSSKEESKSGVCMFNYECTHRGGLMIGSCVDGFLFGACCSLPKSELLLLASYNSDLDDSNLGEINNNVYINTAQNLESNYVSTAHPTIFNVLQTTQRASSSPSGDTNHPTTSGVFINNVFTPVEKATTILATTGEPSTSGTILPQPLLEQFLTNSNQGGFVDSTGYLPNQKYPIADTILLNPDGTIVEDDNDPETLFTMPSTHRTVYTPPDSISMQKSTPSRISAATESPNLELVTFTYVSHSDAGTNTKTTPIAQKLGVYTKTTPIAQKLGVITKTTPIAQKLSVTTKTTPTTQKLGVNTKTTLVTQKPIDDFTDVITKLSTVLLKEPISSSPSPNTPIKDNDLTATTFYHKQSVPVVPKKPGSGEQLIKVHIIEHNSETKIPRPKPTLLPRPEESNTFPYSSTTNFEVNRIGLGSESTSINHIIGLLNDNEPKPEPEPIAIERVTAQPPINNGLSTWVSIDGNQRPWETTSYNPVQSSENDLDKPAPTVIMINAPPAQRYPTTSSTISIPLITKASTKRPYVNTKKPLIPQGGVYLTQKPAPLIITASTGPTSSGHENLINFPPVRNPDLNMSSLTQVEKPTIVQAGSLNGVTLSNGLISELEVIDDPEINTIDPDEDYEDFTTPELVDEKVSDKVHTFVEKIVNSLAGNFQDLENVLFKNENTTKITNQNGIELNNVLIGDSTEPSKKPTEVTTRKPAKKTTTQATTTTNKTKRPTTKRTTTTTTTTTTTEATTTTKKPVRTTSTTTTTTTTKRPTTTTTTTKKPSTTKKPITKKPKPTTTTKKPILSTTPIEYDEVTEPSEADEFTTILNQAGSDGSTADYRNDCGVRPLISKKGGRIVGGKGSIFGSYPWQVLVRESTWLGLFTKNKCGGVLITSKYVITAAHCQPGFLASLVAVFGEYDISGELESKRSVSKNVRRVIVHRQYDPATFENDLAVLELDSAVQYDEHIVPICMPHEGEDFVGRMATVTGWGRLKYGGGVPSVLQEVRVPLIENSVCQEMFQTAGHQKRIIGSFLCAGYANGQKDSCEGDSGGPLMVERDDGHWVLLGTVSHGIKCAAPYLPGVYMRTSYYKPWLKSITGVNS